MTFKNSLSALLISFRSTAANSIPRLTLSVIVLAGCLSVPYSALASKLLGKWDPMATISMQVALQQWSNPIERIRITPDILDEQSLPTVAEEASKQAQVKYLSEKWKKPSATVRKYVDLVWAEAEKREKLEPELLLAIMQKESSLRPKVQSRYGAQGLMQVVPRWHREKLHPSESLFDPAVNIRVGAEILEEYLDQAGGSLTAALTKYSGNARNYANAILKETRKLAQVSNQAIAQAEVSQG